MDVEQRLAGIERKQDRTYILLEQLSEKVQERSVQSDEWRERVERTVWGINGSSASALVVRIDRLEQAHNTSRWITRVAASVIIVGTLSGLWSLLKT